MVSNPDRSKLEELLRNNTEFLKPIKDLNDSANKIPKLLDCIAEFSLANTPNYHKDIEEDPLSFLPSRNLIKRAALDAAIGFIANFPYIENNPAILRACFGVPSRRDRKKGKYGRSFLRKKAFALSKTCGISPDYYTLDSLRDNIISSGWDDSYCVEKFLTQIEIVRKRDPWRKYSDEQLLNDHSEESIQSLRKLFNEQGFETIIPISDQGKLSPDLILKKGLHTLYLELKEWSDDFDLRWKPLFQFLRYVEEARNVVLVIKDNISRNTLPRIQIGESYEGKELQEILTENLTDIKLRREDALKEQKGNWAFASFLAQKGLNPREKCLLTALLQEISSEKLGKLTTEYISGRKSLKILSRHEKSQFFFYDINVLSEEALDNLPKDSYSFFVMETF